jgi:signal transduction histidine kinase/DNA-binding response OmpR family regulator
MGTMNNNIPNNHNVLIDIQRSTLNIILAVVFLSIWTASILVVPLAGEPTHQLMLLSAGIIVLCGVTAWLSLSHFRLAAYLFVLGSWCGVAITARLLGQPVVLYFFATIVLMSSILMPLLMQIGAAVGSTLFIVFFPPFDLSPENAIGAVLMVWVSLITSHIVSRGLVQALNITHHYQAYAVQQMEKARDQRAELARVAQALHLSEENLQRLNTQLRSAYNSAEEARRLKAQFAANVSHELRTPINLIVGFSEVMAMASEAYGMPLPPAYRADIQAIYRNATHLQSLINDILDISQLEAAQLAIVKEETDPRQVIDEAARIVQRMIQGKGLVFRLDLPEHLPVLRLDRTRIRQVLLNLLANAVRFTDQGSITVRAALNEKEVTISIQDTGVGIPVDQLDRVFDEFHQLDANLSRRRGGTGLGLTLSRQFIAQHGGRMWVESEGIPGQGCTFYFTLPLMEPSVLSGTGYRRQSKGKEQTRQMIMWEDDPAIVQLFRGYTRRHTVQEADTLEAVYSLVAEEQPVAVICGSHTDTTDLSRFLAENSPETALITCPIPSRRRAARFLGLIDYLVKPISRGRLLDVLGSIETPVHKILMIDDERDMLRMYQRFLQSTSRDYSLLTACNGSDGLALMRSEQPDAVILDIMLPDLDGFGVLQIMRSDAALRTIPVIAVSAGANMDAIMPVVQGDIMLRKHAGFQPMELVRCIEAISDQITPPTVQAS